MAEVKMRKWARKIPQIVWTLGIDAIDLVTLPLALPIFPVVTEPLGIVFDGIQGFASFLVFEDPRMWVGGTGIDAIVPSAGGLDAFVPSFTISYLLLKFGAKK